MAKKPDIEEFRKIVRKSGGNLTKVAATFKVARKTIYQWAKEDTGFKEAISDERGSLVDECLVSARILALGIPEKDENGNFVGWRERPDGNMIRYILSTLGRNEGFGEESEDADIPTDIDHGISIDSWIKDKLK
ncbi:hypothetical protein NXW91_15660 [Bacteroides fragilis]|nr:hypothetical protein [Bacteroides fragilis]